MAKSIFGVAMSNSSVATFRAWGSALSAQIATMLTRVAQTGDIDWITVARPAGGVYAGSEVYRFNDALQSAAPIFVKFEYGTSDVGSNAVLIRVTLGKSADGAGVIGGQLLTQQVIANFSGQSATNNNCYISGGDSWFALSLVPNDANCGGLFYVERSVNNGGVPSGQALLVGWQTSQTVGQNHRFIDYVNATAETVTGGIIAMPLPLSTDRSIANGTTAPVFPAACISPAGVFWRPRVILGTARQNAGLGEIINGLLDGNSYLSLGVGAQRSDQRGSSFATTLIRWD